MKNDNKEVRAVKALQERNEIQTVAVIGLGYVGLPLVVEFGKQLRTIGFDISSAKVALCRDFIDPAGELSTDAMRAARFATYADDPSALTAADAIIVAVPTPVDVAHRPDFGPLVKASQTVGRHLKRGALVVYESTVYPGATEEICIPILEQASGLTWKRDFWVGYSPERINPSDLEHTLTKVMKVVSGDSPGTLERVAELYERIVEPGVHRASSIMTAEASKVIENTQRDVNIALMNELAIIFDRIGIDTNEVLQAAGTKWNFLKFKPGLVGGHCIGVDPYYLTHKAEMVGYHPQVILAGRRINDGMGKLIAEKTVKRIIASGTGVKGARVNMLGVTFKENCADIRNSKAIDIVTELQAYGVEVAIHDPWAQAADVRADYGLDLLTWDELPVADALVLAVSHDDFLARSVETLAGKLRPRAPVIDVKAALDAPALRARGFDVWRL